MRVTGEKTSEHAGEIKELTTSEEFVAAYPVMAQLRTHLDQEAYLKDLETMREDGYRLFASIENGAIKALAGIAIRTNFYYGRYLYVYDLVTDQETRSRGHGKLLLDHLEELARADGCETIALSSGMQRKDAHRFYEDKMRYDRVSYVFKKEL